MTSLKGSVALVTGASAGIGAAITERLVKEGATVIGCARRVEKIQELANKLSDYPGRLDAIKCDLQKEEDILAMFEEIKNKHGGLDICINNAGLARPGTVVEGKTDDWRAMTEVNVLAVSICTREALKMFELKGSDGHILNMGSLGGHGLPRFLALGWYCATKWMLRTLTECLRLELREKGARTRVTLISPGLVATDIQIPLVGAEASAAILASKECLSAEQVADSVYFALSAAPNMQVSDIIITPTSQEN